MDLEYYAQRVNELIWATEEFKEEQINSIVDEYATDFNLDYETARMELANFNSEAFI
jgi:hypothetical protein